MTNQTPPSSRATCDYCHLPVRGTAENEANSAGPRYCCYGCQFAAQITRARGQRGQATWMVTRLGGSVFLSMGVMVFSLAMYSQDVYDVDLTQESPLAAGWIGVLRYASLVMATPVFLMLGLPVLSNALDQLGRRRITTDVLVIVGVAAAFVTSYISTLTDGGAVYYETACMVLVLLTLGRYLEAIGRLRAAETVEQLHELLPDDVTVWRDGRSVVLPASEVRPGDLVEVRAGDRIAADGVIEFGRAHVDQRIVTGESVPVEKSTGDRVFAGGTDTDGHLRVRATSSGSDTALTRLLALLEEAKRSNGSYERLADRVAAWFVPIVIALASLAALLGYRRGGTGEAIMTSLAVLLIACPCALGIATPLALWVALGRAATRGVLFRNGETVEKLAAVRCVAFDKTGTVTTGRPAVESLEVAATPQLPPDRIREWIRGVAEASNHTLAAGLAKHLEEHGVPRGCVTDLRTVAGRGIAGRGVTGRGATDRAEPTMLRLGSVAMMREANATFPPSLERTVASAMAETLGVVCFAAGDRVVAVAAFSESLRPHAPIAFDRLRANGTAIALLTGDHRPRGERVAEQLGAEAFAELTPEGKVAAIARLRSRHGPVAMVGDGLNDAPALVAADVAIAMGCGADVTRDSGDICLLGDDLRDIPFAVTLAAQTVRTVRRNLFWALAYNVLGIGLAMGGWLNPMVAAGAMVASSLFVVTNSLRLGRKLPTENDI